MRLPTVLTFAALTLAASACGGSASFTVAGEKVINADETLTAVESAFRSDVATDDTVAVGDDARCYYLATSESDIDLRAFCGPVGSHDASGPFNVYRLDSYLTEGGVKLEAAGRSESGVAVRDTGALVRPDKQGVPDELFVAPPALTDDAVLSLEQLPYQLAGGVEDTAFIRFPQTSWGDETGEYDQTRVVALDRTGSVGDGYDQLVAADGHDLVVIELDHNTESATELAVLVNGSRRTIGDIWARYHVISVPADSDDVALEVRAGDIVQTLSLTDGSRGGEGPALWYRDDVTTRVGHHLVRTHQVKGADDGYQKIDFSLTFEISYTDAELTTRDHEGRPAPSGKVWLAVRYGDVRSYDDDAPWSLAWDADTNATLVLEDGTVVEPVVAEGYDGGTLYFAVDDDFTSGTLDIAPDLTWELSQFSGVSDRGSATLDGEQLPIVFG